MNWKKNRPLNWKLYCIIDKSVLRDRSPVKAAEFLFKHGACIAQLRYKNEPSYKMIPIAKKIANVAGRYRRIFLINDRVDVALASGAKGVHLGEGDFPAMSARRLLKDGTMIGKTVHSRREAKKAKAEKPDYVSAGPIFETPLKKNLKKKGIRFIKEIKKNVSVPVFAIGGINKHNAYSIIKNGADGICVTRAIFEVENLAKTLHRLYE